MWYLTQSHFFFPSRGYTKKWKQHLLQWCLARLSFLTDGSGVAGLASLRPGLQGWAWSCFWRWGCVVPGSCLMLCEPKKELHDPQHEVWVVTSACVGLLLFWVSDGHWRGHSCWRFGYLSWCRKLGLGKKQQSFHLWTSSSAVVCVTVAATVLCCCRTTASEPKGLWKNTYDSEEEKVMCCNAAGRQLSCATTHHSGSEDVSVLSEYSY